MNATEQSLARVAAGTTTIEDRLVLGNALDRLRAAEDRFGAVMTAPAVEVDGEQVPVLDWLARFNPHVRAELADLRAAATLTDDHVDSALALAKAGRHRRRRRGPLALVAAR